MWQNGSFYWNELMTRDAEAAKRFYGATLGWTFEAMEAEGGPVTYWVAKVGDESVAGIYPAGKRRPGDVRGVVCLCGGEGSLDRARARHQRRRRGRARAVGCSGRRPHRDRQRQCRQLDGLDDAD